MGLKEYERYGLQLRVNANDPQGLGNIVSVVAAAPAGFYTLYDDGQHWDNNPGDGIYGIELQDLNDSPLTGNYSFIITDAESNKDTVFTILLIPWIFHEIYIRPIMVF